MADMAESGSGKRLFVRQSSGLVRDVSVTNALFFNVAAFVGVGLTLYPTFYSLAFVPVWRFGPFSEYGWAAIVTGLFCVLLALIFASLTSVMPRSGGDYVFTTRIVGPFLGWLESWTLVIASIAIMAFEVPLVLRNLQITGRIIGIGAGGHFFKNANNWFTNSSGAITGWNGLIWSLVVLAVIAGIVLLPTRRFHKVVTIMAAIGVASFVLMFIFGLLATNQSDFNRNLPQYTGGVHAVKIAASGSAILPGYTHNFLGDIFSRTVFPFMLGIVFLQFIGFQYSAYIAGEVRGNVKRGVSVALLGALLIGVIANSLYVDLVREPHRVQHDDVSWGYNYWGGVTNIALPLGQPPSMPLLAVIANKTLWPLWALISLAGAMFPLLLCPVYVNFISRMGLRVEPRPAAAGVVRRGQRAHGRAAERDPGNARAHRRVPVAAELRGAPPLDRAAERQAEPGRDAVVLDLHGRPDVDHAGGERDPDPLPPAGSRPQRTLPPGPALAGPRRGSCSRSGSTGSPRSSRSGTTSRRTAPVA